MKRNLLLGMSAAFFIAVVFMQCTTKEKGVVTETSSFGGFESQVKWGEHLVMVSACNDCHTPKKMSSMGPVLDTALWLSGHPAQMPPPDVDRKEVESKGQAVSDMMTAWVGPWGISYAANLTSDGTGIGNWEESAFIIAIRQGKFKGIPSARTLLPPMPWQWYGGMTDGELKAIFAYLKSTKPISNIVPAAVPPVLPPPGGASM